MVQKISLIVVILIISLNIFSFVSFGATITPYGSITNTSSQCVLLENMMYNDPSFDFMRDWICIRTGEREYIIYFNYDSTNKYAEAYRYYATQSGTAQWIYHIQRTNYDNLSFNLNDYTTVGTLQGTMQSSAFREYKSLTLTKYWLPILGFTLLFFVFRIRKNHRSVSV